MRPDGCQEPKTMPTQGNHLPLWASPQGSSGTKRFPEPYKPASHAAIFSYHRPETKPAAMPQKHRTPGLHGLF